MQHRPIGRAEWAPPETSVRLETPEQLVPEPLLVVLAELRQLTGQVKLEPRATAEHQETLEHPVPELRLAMLEELHLHRGRDNLA